MLKDTTISILAGIALSQHILSPGDPARPAAALMIAVMAFMVLLELEDIWDKRQRIKQAAHRHTAALHRGLRHILRSAHSRIRWTLIRLHTWPIETAQRRHRRQMMQGYIQRLREMPQEHKEQIKEVK